MNTTTPTDQVVSQRSDGPTRRAGPNPRVLAAVVAAAIAAGVALTLGARSSNNDPIIAYASGVPIRLSQAQARAQGLAAVHGDVSKSLGADWRRRVIQSIADDVAIQREAGRLGIVATPAEVEAGIARARGNFSSPEEFAKWLLSNNMDQAELGRRIRSQLLSARLYERLAKDATVTSEEIDSYYRSHLADYTVDGTARPLFEVRSSIEETLLKEKKDRAFGAWLEGVRRGISVRIVRSDWEVSA